VISKPELFALCRERLKNIGGERRHALFVPGRLEFLGKHTDYCGGRSIVCAIEQGIALIATARSDPVVHIIDATGANESCEFRIDPDLTPPVGHWSNYPMTVVRRVARNFPSGLRGADIAFASNLPRAAGLSSSSALIIGFFLVLDAVNDLRSRCEYQENVGSTMDLAAYLATIENGQSFRSLAGDRGVGTLGGCQDHTAILCSRPGFLSQYRFCPTRHERDLSLPPDFVFAIAVSGVVAEKTRQAMESYNRVSTLVSEILALWRSKTGRSDPTLADAIGSAPDAIDRLRQMLQVEARHAVDRFDQFVIENDQIIPAAGDAMVRGDWNALGHWVDQSQQQAERGLKNQVPETIALAQSARQLSAIAASALGAGFGGSVWALLPRASALEFLSNWKESYLRRFPHRADLCQFFLTQAGPAASVVKD